MTKKPTKSQKRIRSIIRNMPYIVFALLCVFSIAALVVGEFFGAYKSFWWWDDMLHTVSGVIVGLVGFYAVYFLNSRYNMAISPLFVAVFAFAFAMTIGVFWEIFEFTMDILFHTNMQRWYQSPDAILIGSSYQGYGLRDTMSDLIVSWFGAILASAFTYVAYKHEKPTVLRTMRKGISLRKLKLGKSNKR